MIGIYKITNPNGQVYIGQSTNIIARIYSHKFQSEKNTLIMRSIKKYGYENHVFEILELCKLEELYIKERNWQEFYFENSLNMIKTKPVLKVLRARQTSKNKRKEAKNKRYVLCLNTGIFYNTPKEASEAYVMSETVLRRHLHGRRLLKIPLIYV